MPSFSGRSNMGSHTERMADSNSSTRVSLGRQPDSMCAVGDTLVVAAEEGEEILRQVVLVAVGQASDDAEIERCRSHRGDKDVAGCMSA